jgi:hypothetical protein
MENGHNWDGIDRRNDQELIKYKVERIILDMNSTKDDTEKIKRDIVDIKLLMTEMKMELKNIVGRSSAITSSIVSLVITVIGGVIGYFVSK